CATVECPGPTGACCLPDGSCVDGLSQDECAAADGEYQGDQSTCDEVTCEQPPTGACCYLDGSCVDDVPLLACKGAGGEYQGDGTACDTAECDKAACCLPETHPQAPCVRTTEPRCVAMGGEFLGIGVECDDELACTDFPGACCFPDGTCMTGREDDCVNAGGVFQGQTTACGSCPQPGACCFPDGSCAPADALGGADCVGTYQGDDVTCDEVTCEAMGIAGCSAEFWRHPMHHDLWPSPFTPGTDFNEVFENAFPGLTLQIVLGLGGGSLQEAGKQAVAALLNAAADEVYYGLTPADVVGMFNAVFPGSSSAYAQLAGTFGAMNALGCPLNGDLPTMPLVVHDGEAPFDTFAAATEGPALPPTCDEGGGLSFTNDVWRLYTAPAGRAVTIGVCNSDFDTRLAVYAASADPGLPIACSDDGCGATGAQSALTFPASAGAQYLVRIGGRGETGAGMLMVEPACAADVNGDGAVDVDDLVAVIVSWGPCGTGCPADVNADGSVDVDDLIEVVLSWGGCEP
ncbi:MAG: hypothetical protein ACYTJ0_20910, partial [Planctomycetota bacterium]